MTKCSYVDDDGNKCHKYANYGYKNSDKKYCHKHKLYNMAKNPFCDVNYCLKRALYKNNYNGYFCGQHKTSDSKLLYDNIPSTIIFNDFTTKKICLEKII